MKAFEYVSAHDLKAASEALRQNPEGAKVLAGGVDLLTELKERIIEPDRLVNIKTIPGLNLVRLDRKGLTLGALVTLATIEGHEKIQGAFTALAEAARSVASPQIRNVGTLGGNLCQRPRCWYYRDETIKCLKKGGSRCYAADDLAENKYNAILGGGPSYIVHPSDCAPALIALGAQIRYGNGEGEPRTVPAEEFFILPRENPTAEHILRPGEILTEVFIPTPAPGTRSTYVKFKEKDSFDWAIASVAVSALTEGDGVVKEVRVVLGGVAPIPWRSQDAEAVLKGKKFSPQLAEEAAEAALKGARPLSKNAYKVPLTRTLVRRALEQVIGGKQA